MQQVRVHGNKRAYRPMHNSLIGRAKDMHSVCDTPLTLPPLKKTRLSRSPGHTCAQADRCMWHTTHPAVPQEDVLVERVPQGAPITELQN